MLRVDSDKTKVSQEEDDFVSYVCWLIASALVTFVIMLF